jgi:hypothetical protein
MQFFFDETKKISADLIDRIARCCVGLVYISETDAPIKVFAASARDVLNADTIRAIANAPKDARVEEQDFQTFFARLTKDEPWHDEDQRVQKKKFLELQNILEENLRDLRVFKIGEVRLSVYAVGLDKNKNVIGVSTQAVET